MLLVVKVTPLAMLRRLCEHWHLRNPLLPNRDHPNKHSKIVKDNLKNMFFFNIFFKGYRKSANLVEVSCLCIFILFNF